MLDIELGKQLTTTRFISSPCLGNLMASASLRLGVVQSTKTLLDLCLADHNSSKFIHHLKHSAGIFQRMIHEAVFFGKRLKTQNLIFLNSMYSQEPSFSSPSPNQKNNWIQISLSITEEKKNCIYFPWYWQLVLTADISQEHLWPWAGALEYSWEKST